jgi:phosphoribosyl-ATP pyrophosphohydrolase/phosphoribosyl-AMP cyclohydrolase
MINFLKGDGLIPVIIQDFQTLEVRMLGYMNEEAWNLTKQTKKVTFFSRSKGRLWTKGEESGHFLEMVDYAVDCDQDTLLIKVHAQGPTCHTGARSCFETPYNHNFLFELERIVQDRLDHPVESSYIHSLTKKGINKIAQKVGEEGVETVIAALAETETDLINESSDLLFHLIVLLRSKGLSLETIAKNLESRHR